MGVIKRKICLLGTFAVGKTSLVQRFVNDRFSDKYLTTIGISISKKLMPPVHGGHAGSAAQHEFLIWDIAGLEKFDPVVMNYFRGASGALAVADLTRPETVDELATIGDQFLSVNPRAALVIIGNKFDLIEDRSDTFSDYQLLAADFGSALILTSAKTGERVEEAFHLLSQKIEPPNG
ncbi:Rab family GTPase [Desulfosarcina sp.]|uniref:Rab family GTPase n=1 Tax=Desulfosarcina sp. TaxID=2027861 RepID=UPI00356B0371